MKFESRTLIAWFADGNTSFGASGPSTSGTDGSGGAGRGVIPRSKVATVGGDTGGRGRWRRTGDVSWCRYRRGLAADENRDEREARDPHA